MSWSKNGAFLVFIFIIHYVYKTRLLSQSKAYSSIVVLELWAKPCPAPMHSTDVVIPDSDRLYPDDLTSIGDTFSSIKLRVTNCTSVKSMIKDDSPVFFMKKSESSLKSDFEM